MINDLVHLAETKLSGRASYDAAPLKDYDLVKAVSIMAEGIQEAITKKSSMVNSCTNVGNQIRKELDLELDSKSGFRMGFFLFHLYADFELMDIISIRRKNDKHTTFYFKILDWKRMRDIWNDMDAAKSVWTQPRLEQPMPWTAGYHADGDVMIRKASRGLLESLSPRAYPMLFNVLNRKQSTGYVLSDRVFEVYEALLGEHAEVFEHTNELLSNEKRNGKLLEAEAVLKSARYVKGQTFYHIYNFDFRGRIYPTSGYFHEQSSDHAKSMIELANKVPLGEDGYSWLLTHATNSWGEDKLLPEEKVDYAIANLDSWLAMAIDPLGNREWFKADKPWAFLQVILELLTLEFVSDKESFESGLVVYLDGTTNGSQHLTALAKDATIAEYVNLVPTDQPGDLYTLIADASFEQVAQDYNPALDEEFQEIKAKLREFRKSIEQSNLQDTWDQLRAYREENKERIRRVAPNFWSQPGVFDKRRKICKRNVMTLGYGSETRGFSDQLSEDCESIMDELKYMEGSWAHYLANLNYKNCQTKLPGPAAMLELFKKLAVRANQKGIKLRWTAPVTQFPAIQSYYEPETQKVDVMYMGRRIQPRVKLVEQKTLKKSKQKSGAAPNIIHSFDAAHLTMTCDAAQFETVTIHDSFGAPAGHTTDLYHIVREQWVEFYNHEPLEHLLEELQANDLMPAIGSLDNSAILDSVFAFS